MIVFPDENGKPLPGGEYLTPTRSGSVHFTAYQGKCLTLTSKTGATFTFNVLTRAWGCQPDKDATQ